MRWKIVPLSEGQLRDVRPEDVIEDGLYRKCETYRGGGGYDQFPVIAEKRLGYRHHLQFIVQLFGCNLDCPYCYVTREGVWGQPNRVDTAELVSAFIRAHDASGVTVFHLMGGAPALQIKHWPELMQELNRRVSFEWAFHSDLMLTERDYPDALLHKIRHPRALYAVDIKGLTDEEHLANTRKPFEKDRFYTNLHRLELADVPFYFTFTAIKDQRPLWDFYDLVIPKRLRERKADAFSIDIINYDAVAFVDRVPWGAQTGVSTP